jgi:hypothetical protein
MRMVASVFFSEPFSLGDTNPAPFDWIIFDAQNSALGLDVATEPAGYLIVLLVWP